MLAVPDIVVDGQMLDIPQAAALQLGHVEVNVNLICDIVDISKTKRIPCTPDREGFLMKLAIRAADWRRLSMVLLADGCGLKILMRRAGILIVAKSLQVRRVPSCTVCSGSRLVTA